MEKFLNKHMAVILLIGGILSTAVTLTAFAYTTFQTKVQALDDKSDIRSDLTELKASIQSIDEFLRSKD